MDITPKFWARCPRRPHDLTREQAAARPAVAKMGDDAVPRLFAPHAPLPKNHGYGNQHRNAAEAKWRAAQQAKQQRAVAKQLGLELPVANPKKRAHDPEQPLAEWAMPTVPQAESDELVRALP